MKALDVFKAPLNGISLVEAGAGTGKTYSIASLYIRLILSKKLMPNQILVLTFTNPAAAELKYRLRDRIKESIRVLQGGDPEKDEFLNQLKDEFQAEREQVLELLQSALYQFDEAAISTIHGFCQRLLKEYSLEFKTDPEFSLLSDPSEVLQAAVDEYWRAFFERTDDPFRLQYQRWVAETIKSPDVLKNKLKELLEKDYAVLTPVTGSVTDLLTAVKELRGLKEEVRKVFNELYEDICHIFDENQIHGGIYREAHRKSYLEEVRLWLNEKESLFDYPEKLVNFGHKFPDNVKGEEKKAQFEGLEVTDRYLEQAESLIQLQWAYFLTDATGKIRARFEAAKERTESLTYDDLLKKVATGLKESASLSRRIRNQFPVALIDEFQDTDPVQYEIFKSVYRDAKEETLFMIGDPKQAIYSFRGADIYTYLASKGDITPGQDYSLVHNYRSSYKLIQAVNKVFRFKADPFLLGADFYHPAEYPEKKAADDHQLLRNGEPVIPLQFIECDSDNANKASVNQAVYESVANEILNLISGKYTVLNREKDTNQTLEAGDIAILVNKNEQALEMQDLLRSRGIRSVLRNKQSVFKTRESDELYLILSAIQDSVSDGEVRAALATDCMGFNYSKLQRLKEEEDSWGELHARFKEIRSLWDRKGLTQALNQLIAYFSLIHNLAGYQDSERRITNFYHLTELLVYAERDQHLSPHSLLSYFKAKREQDQESTEEEQIRLESDEDLIQIITMHSSKGLEFPVVFCPFLHQGIKTDLDIPFSFHEDTDTVIDVGSPADGFLKNKLKALREEHAERVRLAYVALTRAKSACFVSVIEGKELSFSPLASLLCGADKVQESIQAKLKGERNVLSIKLKEELEQLADSDLISVRKPAYADHNRTDKSPENKHNDSLKAASFSRTDIHHYEQLMSFSSLTAGSSHHVADKEGFDFDELDTGSREPVSPELNVFTFPRGAKAGTLLHNIFELIDFQEAETVDKVVSEQLEAGGISSEWLPVVRQWIDLIINSPVLANKLKLSNLRPDSILKEMEFHFPAEQINLSRILDIIRPEGSTVERSSRKLMGFMKGFIDLCFEYQGRFYILDYKSNYLGDRFEDYAPELLDSEIKASSYDVQYHIYTLALHRYLQQVIPDYDYEEHFGGVIYLFMRGLNQDLPGNGVYFDCPEWGKLKSLDMLFKGGNA